MRYRPFGISGKAVSAISLRLRDSAALPNVAAWRAFLFAALENGINTFDLPAGSEVICRGLASTLEAVERRLLFLSLRIEGDPSRPTTMETLSQSVRSSLQRSGAAYFDILVLDETAFRSLDSRAKGFLGDLRAAGLVLQLGVCGQGEVIDEAIASADFDVAGSPFNLQSGWDIRRRIRDASAANMALVAYDPCPADLVRQTAAAAPKPGLFRRAAAPLAGVGTYAFLHQTTGWSASEICLAYALTEPAFATVQVEAPRADIMERLASVADRDLPAGVAAQIEMARFGGQDQAAKSA